MAYSDWRNDAKKGEATHWQRDRDWYQTGWRQEQQTGAVQDRQQQEETPDQAHPGTVYNSIYYSASTVPPPPPRPNTQQGTAPKSAGAWVPSGGKGCQSSKGFSPPAAAPQQQQQYPQKRVAPPPPASWGATPTKQAKLIPDQPGGCPPPAAVPAVRKVQERESYCVVIADSDKEDMAMRVIAGEYVEKGVNHGRRVFQKLKNSSDLGREVDVLMYYWDSRDGAAFEGWWLGNKLGGTQVWGHNRSNNLAPPATDWKVPWDGPLRHSMTVVNKTAKIEAEKNARFEELSVEASSVQAEAQDTLHRVQAEEGAVGPDACKEAESQFPPHLKALTEMKRKVDVLEQHTSSGSLTPAGELSAQLEALRSKLEEELARLCNAKKKAVEDAKNRELEERDGHQLRVMLDEAVPKTNSAEDLVEKTSITSEMIDSYGDDADLVRQALQETEQCAKAAQAAIGEARLLLNGKLSMARLNFVESVKEEAVSKLGKLQKQLQEAQTKLNPLKNVRQQWDERQAAQKLVMEVEEHFALAEVDVDTAEESVALLTTAMPTKDGVGQAQKALQVAEENINAAVRFLDSKKETGPQELNIVTKRGDAAKLRISQLRSSLKEAIERISADGYIEEAAGKLQSVTESLSKMEDVECRLNGVTEVGAEETASRVREAENAAAAAHTALSMARMFLQMKIIEVKRFSATVCAEVTKKLLDIQRQCDAAAERLGELKQGMTRRKHAAVVQEAEMRVNRAEAAVERVKEAAGILGDDVKLAGLTSEELREVSEKTAVCEKDANELLMEARTFISARQIEAKGKDSSAEASAELIKFQARVSNASSVVSRQRKMFTSVEQRLAIRKLVSEAVKRLDAAAEKVSSAEKAAEAIPEWSPDLDGATSENSSAEKEKEAEFAAQEALIAFRGAQRYIEAQGRAQGFAKDALARLEPRANSLQERLDNAARGVKDRVEGNFVRGMLTEAQQKVNDSEAAAKKAHEVKEALAQEGDGSTDQAGGATISDLEKALQAAAAIVSSTKTFLSMKLLATKRLSPTAVRAAEEAIKKMQSSLETPTKSLSDLRDRAAELRREALRREVVNRRLGRGASG